MKKRIITASFLFFLLGNCVLACSNTKTIVSGSDEAAKSSTQEPATLTQFITRYPDEIVVSCRKGFSLIAWNRGDSHYQKCISTSTVELDLGMEGIHAIPEGLENLKQLHILKLDNNQLQSLEGLSALQNLKYLDISFNKLMNLDGMPNFPKLKMLDVSNNQLFNVNQLPVINTLKVVNASNNQIKRVRQLQGLKLLPTLDELYLKNNLIGSALGLDLMLPLLNVLVLDANMIEDIEGLENFHRMDKLSLVNNPIPETLVYQLMEKNKKIKVFF